MRARPGCSFWAAEAAFSAFVAFCQTPQKSSVGVFLDFDSVPGQNSIEISFPGDSTVFER